MTERIAFIGEAGQTIRRGLLGEGIRSIRKALGK